MKIKQRKKDILHVSKPEDKAKQEWKEKAQAVEVQ
jgi:hypothetical protein